MSILKLAFGIQTKSRPSIWLFFKRGPRCQYGNLLLVSKQKRRFWSTESKPFCNPAFLPSFLPSLFIFPLSCLAVVLFLLPCFRASVLPYSLVSFASWRPSLLPSFLAYFPPFCSSFVPPLLPSVFSPSLPTLLPSVFVFFLPYFLTSLLP